MRRAEWRKKSRVRIQIKMIVLVSLTLALMMARCVILTGCADTKHAWRRFTRKSPKKRERKSWKSITICFSGIAGREIQSVLHLRPFGRGNNFPVAVRLVRGDAELLLRMDIIGELDIAVDFGKRYPPNWEGRMGRGVS